jgi:hypothetical protein
MDINLLTEWALRPDTGASARCIARHLNGVANDGAYPHDGDDFGRCERLMDAVPGVRERIGEMAEVNAYWAALAPRWEEIRASDKKTALIQSIIRPIQDADPRCVRIGDWMTISFGR